MAYDRRQGLDTEKFSGYHQRMMTGDEYKMALLQLGWTHDQAAAALGITSRTSFNYAARGAPRYIALALKAFRPQQGFLRQ